MAGATKIVIELFYVNGIQLNESRRSIIRPDNCTFRELSEILGRKENEEEDPIEFSGTRWITKIRKVLKIKDKKPDDLKDQWGEGNQIFFVDKKLCLLSGDLSTSFAQLMVPW